MRMGIRSQSTEGRDVVSSLGRVRAAETMTETISVLSKRDRTLVVAVLSVFLQSELWRKCQWVSLLEFTFLDGSRSHDSKATRNVGRPQRKRLPLVVLTLTAHMPRLKFGIIFQMSVSCCVFQNYRYRGPRDAHEGVICLPNVSPKFKFMAFPIPEIRTRSQCQNHPLTPAKHRLGDNLSLVSLYLA